MHQSESASSSAASSVTSPVSTFRKLTLYRMPTGAHAQDAVCVEQQPCTVGVMTTSNDATGGASFKLDAVYTCLFTSPGGGCEGAFAQDIPNGCSFVSQARVINSSLAMCTSETGLAAGRTLSSVTHPSD